MWTPTPSRMASWTCSGTACPCPTRSSTRDTVVVDGIHVRLKGVAAPEAGHYDERGEPGGEAAKAFMVELVEGHVVVCDLTQERTRGRRAGWCYRDGRDRRRRADQGRVGAGLPAVLGGAVRRGRVRSS